MVMVRLITKILTRQQVFGVTQLLSTRYPHLEENFWRVIKPKLNLGKVTMMNYMITRQQTGI